MYHIYIAVMYSLRPHHLKHWAVGSEHTHANILNDKYNLGIFSSDKNQRSISSFSSGQRETTPNKVLKKG